MERRLPIRRGQRAQRMKPLRGAGAFTLACAAVLWPRIRLLETEMKTIVLVLCLIAVAVPCNAAQNVKRKSPDPLSLAQTCRAKVGREEPEATDGRSHVGQLNVQRFSDCLMGR
jgi:hypothetical protein